MEISEKVRKEAGPSDNLQSIAHEFVDEVKTQYKQEFGSAIAEYRNEVGDFPKSIEDWLVKRNWTEPRMKILSGERANEELKKMGFSLEQTVKDSEILVVYKPPKPLVQFWRKRKKEVAEHEYLPSPKQTQAISGQVIEWGWFGKRLRKIVWNNVSEIEEKYKDEVRISRGNDRGDHTKDFYYVFLLQEE